MTHFGQWLSIYSNNWNGNDCGLLIGMPNYELENICVIILDYSCVLYDGITICIFVFRIRAPIQYSRHLTSIRNTIAETIWSYNCVLCTIVWPIQVSTHFYIASASSCYGLNNSTLSGYVVILFSYLGGWEELSFGNCLGDSIMQIYFCPKNNGIYIHIKAYRIVWTIISLCFFIVKFSSFLIASEQLWFYSLPLEFNWKKYYIHNIQASRRTQKCQQSMKIESL